MDFTSAIADLGLTTFAYVMITLLGICIGSFCNVLIYRIPKGEEFVKTSSHCMTCNHKLAWYDNIPLFSWITLGGKCRYCKVKLSAQYPIVEAFNGLLWFIVFFVKGFSIEALLLALMTTGLLALSVIDWRTFEIANGFHLFFIALAIVQIVCDYRNYLHYIIGFFAVSIPLLLIYILSKGMALGGGDVKLMAACGLLLGWKNITLALMLGCVLGAAIHVFRMKFFNAGRKLAMGPYLSMGIYIAGLWGTELLTWYLSYLGV
jgi:leader peptidase (prepilin peptidase)/N-methyltransferase